MVATIELLLPAVVSPKGRLFRISPRTKTRRPASLKQTDAVTATGRPASERSLEPAQLRAITGNLTMFLSRLSLTAERHESSGFAGYRANTLGLYPLRL
jgi:hypothetical protein